MPIPIGPRRQDNSSTYFVEDRSSNAEMIRLVILDTLVTQGMGGPLAEQDDGQKKPTIPRILILPCSMMEDPSVFDTVFVKTVSEQLCSTDRLYESLFLCGSFPDVTAHSDTSV